MSLKDLFSKILKKKPEKPPTETAKHIPAQREERWVEDTVTVYDPKDAPECWEKRWGKDMITVSDPENTCTVRLYAPFASEGPQTGMLAAVRQNSSDTSAAVYTSPDFGGWFVVGSLRLPWDAEKMDFYTDFAVGPLLMASGLHNPRTLHLPDRMRGVSDFGSWSFLNNILIRLHTGLDDLDEFNTTTVSFFLDGIQYIDYIFCAIKGEHAWKVECVIPARDHVENPELYELPYYIFRSFCANIPSEQGDVTCELPDSGGIFLRDGIRISPELDQTSMAEGSKMSELAYLNRPNDPFSEKFFGTDMVQVRNEPCGYKVQLYGPAAGNSPVSRMLPHHSFDIRLDLFSSGEGDSWYLISTIRPKDGTSLIDEKLTSRDWLLGINAPNVELLLPERFCESSFSVLHGESLPVDRNFLERTQCTDASPYCFAFQMDGKVYKDYFLKIRKGCCSWYLECIIPAQNGAKKPFPTEFVPPGYMFGSFAMLI